MDFIECRLDHKVDVKDKLGYVMQAITLTRHKLNGRVPLIGNSSLPKRTKILLKNRINHATRSIY
jgi:uroporphyrinogen-III decarboxylase